MSTEGNRKSEQFLKDNRIELQKQFIESDDEALLETRVVAAYLNLSLSWFHNKAVYGGGIPFVKLGNKRLYKKADVLKWYRNNSIGSKEKLEEGTKEKADFWGF